MVCIVTDVLCFLFFFFFLCIFFFFFFQAEDGIRDRDVTGVQTCLFRSSLTYIVLSTRGCSPRRPAAVMSTNGRENQSLPRIFKGLQERTGHHKKCGALPVIKPYLLVIRFHGVRPLTRKENSSQGSRRRLRVQLRCRKSDP